MQFLRGLYALSLKVVACIPSHGIRRTILKLVYRVRIGKCSVLYSGFEIRSPRKLNIGTNTVIGHKATLDARGGLTIGNRVNLSSEVMIWAAQHDYRDPHFRTVLKSVVIEDYAWLGPRCIVLPGVTIGEGAVVAAGAVVSKDIEPYTVVAGVPAQKMGDRPKDLDYNPAANPIPFV